MPTHNNEWLLGETFTTLAVSFGTFLDVRFTAEKNTEQTRGVEKLRVETWL